MKSFYGNLLGLAALSVLFLPWQASAQDFTVCPDTQDECIVEWSNDGLTPVINALRNTIANDDDGGGVNVRPEGRYYTLRRGGLYYNEDRIVNTDWNLRLYGQTADQARPEDNVCGDGDDDCGPAVLQRYTRADATIDGVMIESNGDGNGGQDLRNLWLQGMSDTGVTANYEPMVINSSNSVFNYDGVIFDRNDWHHLGFKSGGNDITIRNSSFRNLTGVTQRYEGRGIRLEAGAVSLVMENNSFINMTMTPVQSEAAPIEYFVFNHNTLVNFGLVFNAGGIWKQAFITNNVMVNPHWQGESADLYEEPNRADPYSGIFGIATLPAAFGLETDRRIVLANNAWYLDPAIEAHYATFDPPVRAQPLVNDSTMSWFNIYDGMVIDGNLNVDPGIVNGPFDEATYDSMFAFITDVSTQPAPPTPFASVVWDPGRDPNPLAINFPLPEDLSYTNADLQTAGTDGLPLGDLNWFPASKDDYMTNRESYVAAIEALAGGAPETPIANPQYTAEGGTVTGGTVHEAQGFTSLFMESSGFMEWSFDLAADGVVGFDIQTMMEGNNARGQRFILDGVSLQNDSRYGELFYCDATADACLFPLPSTTEWVTYQFRNEHIVPETDGVDALNMTAGTHTLRIEPSWGYQSFSNIDIVDPASGDTVVTLTPAQATTAGLREDCEDPEAFCPQGFKYVGLDAAGSVAWAVDLPANTMSVLPQIFYQGSGAGEIHVDGAKVADIAFPLAEGTTASNILAPRFNVTGGAHTIAVVSVDGGLNIDYVIFNAYELDTAVDEDVLPDGWALDQNYPNPFSQATSIPIVIGEAGPVRLEVYDVVGRRVATLVDQTLSTGSYLIPWNAHSGHTTYASGVYFYRLETPVGHQVRQMILVK